MVSSANEEIVQIIRSDKTKGIRLLFDHYYQSLVLYADRYLRDNQKAEDIVQEFFVKLWEDNYLEKVPVVGLTSYLFIAVRNSCLVSQNKKDILRYSEELSHVEVPVEVFMSIDEERINRVMQEVERLPLRNKQVVECVMIRGLKYKEAAQEMDISVNTVKFLLKEATRRLRMNLSDSDQQILFIFLENFPKKTYPFYLFFSLYSRTEKTFVFFS